MQDRSPPTRQNLLATHGRTIHWVIRDRIRLASASRDVRIFPKADIRFQRSICRDGPFPDQVHCSKTTIYSITSSAMLISPGGNVRPSVLAVLRFMTNSNLIGSITGKSDGFSPLIIRAV